MRKAFTLVELLVVMAIIAILSGLGARVAYKAMITAKNTAIRMEIGQLDAALKAYKEKFGEYPPDGLGNAATNGTATIMQHISRAFPRCTNFPTGQQLLGITPQTALAFWLGGLPDANGVPNGFSADPTNPFDIDASGNIGGLKTPARIKPFYEFDTAQLAYGTVSTGTSTTYCFWPKQAIGNKTTGAVIYFRAENGGYSSYNGTPSGGTKSQQDVGCNSNVPPYPGFVFPAVDSRIAGTTPVWINATSCQIFSAGLDTQYGALSVPLQFPAGTNYQPQTYDDVTNFSTSTLKNSIP